MAGASTTGRPRRRPRTHAGEPRAEIVAAAVDLFARKGVASTTMSEIAEAAGLQQSSLYYWFRRKELVVEAAFDVDRAPLDFLRRTAEDESSAAVRLYRLVRFDVEQLCSSPLEVNEVLRMAVADPEVFAGFWADRQALHDAVERLVAAGVDDGEFVRVDPTLAALMLLSSDEGVPNWFRLQSHSAAVPFRHEPFDVATVSRHAATAAVRALLARPDDLEAVVSVAEQLDARVAPTEP